MPLHKKTAIYVTVKCEDDMYILTAVQIRKFLKEINAKCLYIKIK